MEIRHTFLFATLAILLVITAMSFNQLPTSVVVSWFNNDTLVAQRGGENLVAGTGLSLTSEDEAADDRVKYTYSLPLSYRLPLGCSDGQIAEATSTSAWICANDDAGGGSPVILDLGDDGSNESTDLVEIAITGDANNIFSESSVDKLLVEVASAWPTADTANDAVGPGCSSGDCFIDGVTTSGNILLVWEGTTSDGSEITIVVTADPTVDATYTLGAVADHEWAPTITPGFIMGDADEGIIQMGTFYLGQADDTVSTTVLDDIVIFRNDAAAPIENISFVFIGPTGNPRFVLAVEGADLATYNPRSFVIGPAATLGNMDENILCSTNFSVIDCDTGATGADLGVQDDVEIGGTLYVTEVLDTVGAADMDYGSADVTDHTFTTDGTGDSEFVIPEDSISPTELEDVDTPADEECATYEAAGTAIEWQACGTGGSPVILDLGDDDANESTDLVEIATTGDTNSIFTESSVDKLLIAVGNSWPIADTADALSANGANCGAGNYPLGVDASGASESCTADDDTPDSDAEVPDAITVAGGTVNTSTITLNTGANPTVDGQIIWDTTTERLEVGDDGVATLELYPGAHTTDTGPSPDCSGTTTYQDGEGGCDDISNVYADESGDTYTGTHDFSGSAGFSIPHGAAPTVDASGEVAVDSTNGQVVYYSTSVRVLDPLHTAAYEIESPTSSEDLTWFPTERAITIQIMRAVLVGSSTPSVTWTVRHSTDRSAAGNEVVTSGTTTTSTTTGSDIVSFNDATIPADSWIWIETTAQSGTVNNINIALHFTTDRT